jgi:polyhydroxybutyrate depolymerase
MDATLLNRNIQGHPSPYETATGEAGCLHYIFAAGSVRTYGLCVPAACQPGVPAPLVLNLHGMGFSIEEQASLSAISRKADEQRFIVVYPQAQGTPACWQIRDDQDAAPDLVFMEELIAHLCSTLCIDHQRIFVTGLSNGAGMANRMACALSDVIAAAGLVAGAYPAWDGCCPSRPVPVIAFHGTADPVVPYEGLGHALPSIQSWARGWAVRNGCSPAPAITSHTGSIIVETWCDAMSRAVVTLYTHPGGHVWPGSGADLTSQGPGEKLAATNLIWDFFAAHPMP